MVKYNKEIQLEVEPYKNVKLTVLDCASKKEADAELREWLDDYPELTEMPINQRIIKKVLK